MASIKTEFFAGMDAGTESADRRGDLFQGHDQGDEHTNIPQLEVDPAPDDAVEIALLEAPKANAKVQEGLKAGLGEHYGVVAQTVHRLPGGDGSATCFGIRTTVRDD